MSYIETNLLKDEAVEYTGNISLFALAPQVIIGLIVLVCSAALPILAVLALIIFIRVAITYKTTELAITNKRVIAKFGFIRRDTIEMKLNKVESVQVDQGIIGRIFNFGSIVISGAGNPKAPIPYISNPVVFRTKVFELQED